MSLKSAFKRLLPDGMEIMILPKGERLNPSRGRSAYLGISYALLTFPSILIPGLWHATKVTVVNLIAVLFALVALWTAPFIATLGWVWVIASSGVAGRIKDIETEAERLEVMLTSARVAAQQLASEKNSS